jgi:Protein of unknown function (DUF2849)
MAQHPQILTANRLRSGDVVYWKGGAWVETLEDAEIFPDKAAAETALKGAAESVRDRLVVSPYLFDVVVEGHKRRPVKEREIIRAAGPSVRLDLGKQANEAIDVSL